MENNRVYFFDTTLRDGEQTPGVTLQGPEKLEIAHALDRLGIDVIEAGFPAASQGDFESVKAIADAMERCTVAGLARTNKKDIERTYEALKGAKKSRLHMFIATSDIHLEYKLKMTREEVIAAVTECLDFAKGKFDEIEFSAEDASRTDLDYLCRVFEVAIAGGATILNVPDTVGYMTPQDYYHRIKYVKEHTKGIEKAIISVHCHDDLGMAVANTLAALEAGARQVEGTINGIGERAGNAAIEEVTMALRTRADFYGLETNLDTKQFSHISHIVSKLTGIATPPNKAIVGKNAFAHESGIHQHGVLSNSATYEIMTPESVGADKSEIVLGKHSGKHAFSKHVEELGFHLSSERIDELFVAFKSLADKKKEVFDNDIIALILDGMSYEKAITVIHHHYHSNESGYAYADIRLQTPSGIKEDAAVGDGPVDASLKAIERVVDIPIHLVDYGIRAVTSGKDALGETTLKLEHEGRFYYGRGISTDIITSSVNAFISAINAIYLATELEKEQN